MQEYEDHDRKLWNDKEKIISLIRDFNVPLCAYVGKNGSQLSYQGVKGFYEKIGKVNVLEDLPHPLKEEFYILIINRES